ncbi:hypothetical protein HYW59_00840 [Candidatus Kaiserbacteria bacterium]|nr:hypothetical protein [Candidatus Kaiserbacteria bacterium]
MAALFLDERSAKNSVAPKNGMEIFQKHTTARCKPALKYPPVFTPILREVPFEIHIAVSIKVASHEMLRERPRNTRQPK